MVHKYELGKVDKEDKQIVEFLYHQVSLSSFITSNILDYWRDIKWNVTS